MFDQIAEKALRDQIKIDGRDFEVSDTFRVFKDIQAGRTPEAVKIGGELIGIQQEEERRLLLQADRVTDADAKGDLRARAKTRQMAKALLQSKDTFAKRKVEEARADIDFENVEANLQRKREQFHQTRSHQIVEAERRLEQAKGEFRTPERAAVAQHLLLIEERPKLRQGFGNAFRARAKAFTEQVRMGGEMDIGEVRKRSAEFILREAQMLAPRVEQEGPRVRGGLMGAGIQVAHSRPMNMDELREFAETNKQNAKQVAALIELVRQLTVLQELANKKKAQPDEEPRARKVADQ